MRLKLSAIMFLMAALMVIPASAAPIGILTTTACQDQGVTVTATTIDWLPAGGGTGCINTNNPTSVTYSDGVMTQLNAGAGVIKDLPGTGLPLAEFMTFGNHPNLDYNLLGVTSGVANTACTASLDPNAPVCSVIPGSPFVLRSGYTGTTVTLGVFGTATDTDGASNWIGTFSVDFAGESPAQVQTRFVRDGSITSGHSGSFVVTSAVPEPTTMAIVGSGLVLLGVVARRRKV